MDSFAFLGGQSLDRPRFRRADFVLHLHGFDDQEALTRFHMLTRRYQHTYNFSSHGRSNLLAPREIDFSPAASAPGAGVLNIHAIFASASVQQEESVCKRFHTHLERTPIQKDGIHARGDLHGIGFNSAAVDRSDDARRFITGSRKIDAASATIENYVTFHRVIIRCGLFDRDARLVSISI
jgi:hypothetical protein